ncbi:MAG: universal stress protein [Candidatus Nitrosotenuis sp.]|nr:MAG: universal stress protein [Candidatus Nitrosotenuis sp.]
MNFKNILIPHDGSNFSDRAFKTALDLAKKYNSEMTIIICIDIHYSGTWYLDNRISDQNFKRLYKAAEVEIGKLGTEAKKFNITLNSAIVESTQITKSIVDYAKSHNSDLIVMGAHGRSGLDKLILGSVANGVLQKASCPVLVVK